jgi:hypothetical protein
MLLTQHQSLLEAACLVAMRRNLQLAKKCKRRWSGGMRDGRHYYH